MNHDQETLLNGKVKVDDERKPGLILFEISCDFIWILGLNRSLFSLYYSLNSFLS